jgi:feruloyl-CoA synthase
MDGIAADPVRPVPLGTISATLDRRADGTMVVRSHGELGNYPRRSTDRLAEWAAGAADRPMLAWRGVAGAFESITYADAFDAIQHIGQALLDRGLSAAHPVSILSGNDCEPSPRRIRPPRAISRCSGTRWDS